MRIIYEAFDGKRFDTREDCEKYESSFYLDDLCKVSFFDANDSFYTIDSTYLNDENVYAMAEKVIIHNENELKGFLAWAEDCGWCEFYDFDSPGTWIRHQSSFYDNAYWTLER